jgi:uncharacterized membrane protein YhaH (DUF805 family)
MDWVWYLFKFEGRINRAKYWLAGLIIACWTIFLMLLLSVPIGYLFGWPDEPQFDADLFFNLDKILALVDPESLHKLSLPDLGSILVNLIPMPLFLWVLLATSVKRLHDRDKSGWWIVLLFFFPHLIRHFDHQLGHSLLAAWFRVSANMLYFWGVIELYFLPGTPRTNPYGADPLAKVQTRPRSPEVRRRVTTPWDPASEVELIPHIGSPPTGMHVNRGA